MSKLIVLSEIDCIDFLRRKEIYPSEYYTSFEDLKNRVSFLQDAIIVCILAGTCSFSKRHILEFCMMLQKRAENEFDNGVKEVYILTDTVLPNCKSYYLYRDIPLSFTHYKGWSKKKENLDVWGSLEYDKCSADNCLCFYSDYDKQDSTKTLKSINQRFSELDELIDLIKIPQINVTSE